MSLVIDKAGNLYVANYWASTIEKFTPGSGRSLFALFASNGLHYPTGLAIDSADNLYAANGGDLTIQKFTRDGLGSLFARAPERMRPFGGLTCDDSGNLYLGCQVTNSPGILKVTPSGVQSVFSSGPDWPSSLAFDSAGILYTANYGSDSIAKFSPDGVRLGSVRTTHSPWGIAIRPACRIVCPGDLVVSADAAECGAVVDFTAPPGTNCARSAITCAPPPGSFFPLGTHAVTCAAQDAAGQPEDVCTFQVTVRDEEPPAIDTLSATPQVLWPPNHQMRRVKVLAAATDTCELRDCKIISVTSNEPTTRAGARPTPVDWQVTGDLTLNLRAERAAVGTGRTYTITVACTDASGNISTAETQVTVPRDNL